ncbi:MAG TPA: methyltransferase domain-containing protein [Steroidobacteraceae bacterium]|nr:methyltransferase domain-containing protein [Steroidobacteraceae bacterium]
MLTPAHPFFPKFRALVAQAAASRPVYDLGTSGRFAKELSFVRDVFDEQAYFAGGFSADPAVVPPGCDLACDVQRLDGLTDGCAGAVLSMQVLEHVEDPLQAAREMLRILRPGGIALVAVPFMTSYHGKRPTPVNPVFQRGAPAAANQSGHGEYHDFWRFTHEGLAHLLATAGFARVDVWPIDGPFICRLELLGVFRRAARIPPLRALLAGMDRPRLGKATSGHVAMAVKP